MGQAPDINVRFAFSVGRGIVEDDAIVKVGLRGLGLWTALNALACEHDGRFKVRTARVRLAEFTDEFDVDLNVLGEAGLVVPDQEAGWMRIIGWEKWQTRLPKTDAQRTREWRERKRGVTAGDGRDAGDVRVKDNDNDNDNDEEDGESGLRVGDGVREFQGPHGVCSMEGVHVHVPRR